MGYVQPLFINHKIYQMLISLIQIKVLFRVKTNGHNYNIFLLQL